MQAPRQINLAHTAYWYKQFSESLLKNLKFKFYEFLDGYIWQNLNLI